MSATSPPSSPSAPNQFQPYVPDDAVGVREFTWVVLVVGIAQAAFFGLADSYLALKLGMTMGASIPAAVISMSILRGLLKRDSVLENNLVQNMASVGESLATGAMFTIPALLILKKHVEAGGGEMPLPVGPFQIYFIACMGGLMGILFMIPMRRNLIVKEHGRLRYPEGTACAEVLIAGDKGGQAARAVFSGIVVSGLYNVMMKTLGWFKEIVTWPVTLLKTEASFQLAPSLLAVGFILGLPTCGIMVSGAVLGWFVIIPMIGYFGAGLTVPIAPAPEVISKLAPIDLWDYYLRYIGAGAVAFGGLVGLLNALPTIKESVGVALREMRSREKILRSRTNEDLPMPLVMAGWVLIFLLIAFYQKLNLAGLTGALLAVVFSFFFVTVSSRIVGIVGTSSMPLSGMTIGALLITCLVVQSTGLHGAAGIGAALVIGAMICIAIAMGGDISQDLKIGFLVGASPKWVQITQVISVLVSSMVVCQVVHLLSPLVISGELRAPQANLMFLVSQGVLEGNLPWVPVCIGAAIAACVEMLGIGSLPFAVGLYLPLELSTTLAFGGLIHYAFHRFTPVTIHKKMYDHGILLCSGLVAGDALTGLVMAGLSARGQGDILSRHFAESWHAQSNAAACLAFALLMLFLALTLRRYLIRELGQAERSPESEPGATSGSGLDP
jgi:putative OPT family oligopeptide transporter